MNFFKPLLHKDFFVISHEHFLWIDLAKENPRHIWDWPRFGPFFSKSLNCDPKPKIPKNQKEKLNRFYYCQISKFWFFKSALLLSDQFWANILYVREFLLAESLQKTCLYVHEKLQRNPSVGSCLKISIFRPYGFVYFGFLTNARRGAMRSKTQWVFYRDLDWWPRPQKVQFKKSVGFRAHLGSVKANLNFRYNKITFWH